jgi:AmiR/NasT family two-component response regulator
LGQSGQSSQSALEARKKELEKELEIARKERELERKEAEKKLQEAQSSRHIPIAEKSNSILGKMGGLFSV